MQFENRYHFKNYLRKIGRSANIEDSVFDNKFAPHFIELYRFTTSYQRILEHLGLGEILKHTVIEIRRTDYNDFYAYYTFISNFEDSQLVLKELKEFMSDYEHTIDLTTNKKLFNYFRDEDVKPFWKLKWMFRKMNKEADMCRGNLTPSPQFIQYAKSLASRYGSYFLYNRNKELLYVGKSVSVGDRIISSIGERKSFDGFARIAFPNTRAEIHVYEPYYIVKEKPALNRESNNADGLTFDLPTLRRTNYLRIFNSSG